MDRRVRRGVLLVAVVLAAVVLLVAVESRIRRPTSPLPVSSGVPGWVAGPAAEEALTEVAATVHDGRIWVAGGLAADGRPVASVQVLEPATGTWAQDVPLPEPLHHAALASDGQTLFLLGGFRADGSPGTSVYVRRGEAWRAHVPLPQPRAAGAAAWDGVRIVYAGGVGQGGVSDDVWALGDGAWRRVARLSEPREHLAAASDGAGKVFVLGGRRGGLEGNLGTADLVTAAGAERLPALPTRRGGVATFFAPSVGACLVGGESPGGTHGEVECVAADGSVVRLPDLARPRHGLGAVVVDGTAYALLGGERPGLFVSDAVETLSLP